MSVNKTREAVRLFIDECGEGKQDSLSPLLSTYRLLGKPMDLRAHFQFLPMFKLIRPEIQTFQCARQVGKSFGICALGGLLSGYIPGFNTLFVQPRFDQVKRLNDTVMRPLLKSSLLKNDIISPEALRSLLIKNFNNNSIMYMDYAFISSGRLRGISGVSFTYIDEAQDIDSEFIPIIQETMSATMHFGFTSITGTPKTTDGQLSLSYDAGSQAHIAIRCGCGKTNIASADQDIFRMIGPKGIICASPKCGRTLDTRNSFHLHAYPERAARHASYHLSQSTHPLHCAIPGKWDKLLQKMADYPKLQFYNEVLGLPCDESVNLLTPEDIKRACNGIKQDYGECVKLARNYDMLVLGVDWSGGGSLGHSFTSGGIVGSRPGSDILDCIYSFRLPMGLKPEEEAKLLTRYFADFKCNFFAHDYTGAGYLREVLMAQQSNGVNTDRLIPFTYGVAPRREIISKHSPTDGSRSSFILDKPRSLALMISLIKNGKITLPVQRDSQPVLTDLLSLIEDPRELDRGNILYLITKKANRPDDFAHGLNFATSAIWYSRGSYPKISDVSRYEIPETTLNEIDPFWKERAGIKRAKQ